ncbi:uncharacterized protein LOC128928723 [Callithrix jacchus]
MLVPGADPGPNPPGLRCRQRRPEADTVGFRDRRSEFPEACRSRPAPRPAFLSGPSGSPPGAPLPPHRRTFSTCIWGEARLGAKHKWAGRGLGFEDCRVTAGSGEELSWWRHQSPTRRGRDPAGQVATCGEAAWRGRLGCRGVGLGRAQEQRGCWVPSEGAASRLCGAQSRVLGAGPGKEIVRHSRNPRKIYLSGDCSSCDSSTDSVPHKYCSLRFPPKHFRKYSVLSSQMLLKNFINVNFLDVDF